MPEAIAETLPGRVDFRAMTIAPGRRALITGGASGFGLEIAARLQRSDARVAILDIDPDRLDTAAQSLGADALFLQTDVRSPASVSTAVTKCVKAFGGLDTLVHSAGVVHIKPLDEVDESDWDLVLDVNLKGAFVSAQAAAPALRASGRGRIVAIGADTSRRGTARLQAYCASKFGLVGLTESLAAELAADNVTVNCVCPVGCPTTEMGKFVLRWKTETTGAEPNAIMDATARLNPLGRNATEEDVANAVLYFISNEASFLTGVALDVDGGAHLGTVPGT
jgi:NAD(P)-dependent dehydrogenase (short-subunit alcohol dehydrogenase family)